MKPIWWCPECKVAIYNLKPCASCGVKYVPSWRCDRCGAINISGVCQNCGRGQGTMMRSQRLEELLLRRESEDRPTNLEIITRFAYGFASGRKMPHYLVEDSLAEAYIKIFINIHKFDSSRAKFTTWAIEIVKNTLINAAIADLTKNKKIALSLDDHVEGDDGNMPLGEAIPGESLDATTLIESEEREEALETMWKLADHVFGKYLTEDEDGNEIEASLLEACMDAFKKDDGIGWGAIASRETGVSSSSISQRRVQAERVWRRLKAEG